MRHTRSASLLSLLAIVTSVSLAAAQSPGVRIHVTPERVEAGRLATVYVEGPASSLAGALLDARTVADDSFLRRMARSSWDCGPSGCVPCAVGASCFSSTFVVSVRRGAREGVFRVTLVDAKGGEASHEVRFQITAAADANGDGLPDVWQHEYGLWLSTPDDGPNGDPDHDGRRNADELWFGTNPRGGNLRYFAEGSAGDRQPLRTSIVVRALEPDDPLRPHVVHITAVGDDHRERVVTGFIRDLFGTSFNVLDDDAVADRVKLVTVEASVPVVVERVTTSGMPYTATNSSFGVQVPSKAWYFADGHTAGGLDEFLLLFNPTPLPVTADLTYADDRREVHRRTRVLEPWTRTTVWVNQDDPQVRGSAAAVTVQSSEPIFAERAFRHSSPGKTVPHDSVTRGTAVPSSRWHFPDVDGRGPYATSLAVLNTSDRDADVTATLYFARRPPVSRSFAVGAFLRRELSSADLGIGPDESAAVSIRSTASVVAERVTAGTAEAGGWRRAAAGVTWTGTEWWFATRGPLHPGVGGPMQSTDFVIANLSSTPARVMVSSFERQPGYMGGSRPYEFVLDIDPERVVRVPVASAPLAGVRYIGADAVTVTSVAHDGHPAAAIIVERTDYLGVAGVARASASSIIGNVVR